MSHIRMKVFIRNESDATLSFVGDEILHGDYTPDWHPPAVIVPGERKGFQGEGNIAPIDIPVTGTEGRVRYKIMAPGGGGELYIHWDSPLVESQYGNTFHVWAPPDWEVSHWGGQGHEAELEIRLRRTVPRFVPNFNPHGRGFVFTNHWKGDLPVVTIGKLWNRLFDALPGPLGDLGVARLVDENWLPITHADTGLCGGMVYTVIDYYQYHLLPPIDNTSPQTTEDELFEYVRDRLIDSFDITGQGHRFLGYSSPHYPNGDEGVLQNVTGLARGRSWVTYRDEWPRVQADIEAGKLSPLGLIQSVNLDIGQNHQVLAYGYCKSGQNVTLFIYDPNEGQKEVKYRFDITATDGEVHIKRCVQGIAADSKHIWCFFRINGYGAKLPPRGRRITSVRDAISASSPQSSPYSVRAAIVAGGSVTEWLHTL